MLLFTYQWICSWGQHHQTGCALVSSTGLPSGGGDLELVNSANNYNDTQMQTVSGFVDKEYLTELTPILC